MIIESAFYKLPEIIFSEGRMNYQFNERTPEAALVNYFTNALMLEFNSRNIANPMEKVIVERPYPVNKSSHVDVYVDYSNCGFESKFDLKTYGINYDNYIEAKCFTKKPQQKENMEPSTYNTAIIVNDLLRLQKYAPLEASKYFLVHFDDVKSYYLAYSNRKEYLDQLFTPGLHENIEIPLEKEVKTFKEAIKPPDLMQETAKFSVYVYESRSFTDKKHSAYLIKILK